MRNPKFGPGPVFAFESVACARRWQWYAARSLFVGSLLVALGVIALGSRAETLQELARLGEGFYIALIGTLLTLVLLAAPAAAAGAICHDRATGMMTHVLTTDLCAAEIVLGKLAARLVPSLGLVACSLPLASMLTLLGGVDPDALIGAFAVAAALTVLGCSLAFAFSLLVGKAHEALMATYAIWGIWLVGRPFVGLVNRAFGWSLEMPPLLTDPYTLAFAPYWRPGTVGFGDYAGFAAACLAASCLLATASTLGLRAVCTQTEGPPKRRSATGRLRSLNARLAPTRLLPAPPLDFNPVLWREWHRSRPSRAARLAVGVYAAAAIVGGVAAVLAPRNSFSMAWVNGLQVSIGLLLLCVSASTSLAEERVRGGLDVLLTTPLTTREIVLGKWLGTMRLVAPLAAAPALVALLGGPAGPNLVVAATTFVFVVTCGGAVSALGLATATWCTRPGRATAAAVTAYVLVAVGWMFAAMWLPGPGPGSSEGPMMASPFFFAGQLAADLCGSPGGRASAHLAWAAVWILAYGAAGVGLLAATLATFNRNLGRA